MANFADRLREIRKEKGLTQKQVADAIGIAERNYRRIEAGNGPSLETIQALADYYERSVDYLLGRVNFWHDAEGRITVKVPPDIMNLNTDALKKQLEQD